MRTQKGDAEYEYLVIREAPSPGKKTKVWSVYARRTGLILGEIKWLGAWRQYAFFPASNTVFNRECLEDLNGFMDTQMRLRRKAS